MKVALLASSGIELLKAPLAEALQLRGLEPEFWLAGFAQYRQAILDPSSGIYSFAPELTILHLDGADLFGALLEQPLDSSPESREELARECLAELQRLCGILRERLPQTLLLLNTVFLPPRNTLLGLEYNTTHSLVDVAYLYNRGLSELAREDHGTRIVDAAGLMTFIGHSRWSDPRMWCLARSRLGRDAARMLARRYAATLASYRGWMRKVLVLDLDNVLWGGIVGEDGPNGVVLGQEGLGLAFAEFQQELLNLNRKGLLLAVCSKNNHDDALAAIQRNPAMRLRRECFAALRINWEDKATNIRSLAEELNVGLDALVFIDDDPVERAWVRQALPQVLVPEWPTDPADYVGMLLELEMDAFEKLSLTQEDRRRGAQYGEQALRRELAGAATSLEEFYASLRMRIRIGSAGPGTLARIAQLTLKTNQFNLTTRRYSEAEIAALAHDRDARVFWLALSDRFGDSGIVGVLILRRIESGTWEIDTLLLSCRVMGRTVERALLGYVIAVLRHEGASRLIGEYRPTPKNASVADLYPKLGFSATEQARSWVMDLESQQVAIPEWFEIEEHEDALDAS